MKIVRNTDINGAAGERHILAVGNFDGIHVGHQKVFDVAIRQAGAQGLTAAILTFARHPLKTLRPEMAPRPLMELEDRLKIARTWGFKTAFILDFDTEMALMPPEAFMARILIEKLGMAGIVAGIGWRFGKDRTGDMDFLKAAAGDMNIGVWEVQPVMAAGKPVSSTRIRDLLARGDVKEARKFLGRPHFVRGEVRPGRGRGREIGFPTVNLDTGNIMVPSDGVYAGAYLLPGQSGPAAVNVGSSPTFEDSVPGVEAHLLQWDGDLYGSCVTIAFLQRLRDEKAFGSAEALSRQITEDAGRTLEIFTPPALRGIEP